MQSGGHITWRVVGAVCLMALPLCAVEFRLPAIDPSGERIFRPLSEYTTLDLEKDKVLCNWTHPTPAYTNPQDPPKCGSLADQMWNPLPTEEPREIKPKSWVPKDRILSKYLPPPLSWLEDGELQITPRQTIARVESEVILTGGICTAPGILISGEVVEWQLDRRGTGRFVDAGSQYIGKLHSLVHGRSSYVSPDYALTMAATGPRVLTRGTSTIHDDMQLLAGQTWVSLYSDREGTSYIAARAPRVPSCQTPSLYAMVHWIDAEWEFPAPIAARADTPQPVTTRVRTYRTGLPRPGWIVRYEILSGDAVFDGNGSKVVETTSDADGLATVTVQAPNQASAPTRIGIRVIKPATQNSPALQTGQGETTITWNSVSLNMHLAGPPMATLDEELSYLVTITNSGAAESTPLVLEDLLPPELEFLTSNPPARVIGDRLTWEIPPVIPGQPTEVLIRCRAARAGMIQHCVRLTNAAGVPRESCVSTQITPPPLNLQVSIPQNATVGDRVTFRLLLQNRGNQDLQGVSVSTRYGEGLEHFDPDYNGPFPGARGVLERTFDYIAAGGSLEADISFTVRQAGTHCIDVVAQTRGGSARQSACLTAVERPRAPAVSVSLQVIEGEPGPMRIGQLRSYRATARNVGTELLTNLLMDVEIPQTLQIMAATSGHVAPDFGLRWSILNLPPGEARSWDFRVRGQSPAAETCVRAAANNDQRATDLTTDCFQIIVAGQSGGMPASFGGADESPPMADAGLQLSPVSVRKPLSAGIHHRTTPLQLDLHTRAGRVERNQTVDIYITLTNTSRHAVNDVDLQLVLPKGVMPVRSAGPGQARNLPYDATANGGLDYEPIRTIRPGERLTISLEVRCAESGATVIQGQASAAHLPLTLSRSIDLQVGS